MKKIISFLFGLMVVVSTVNAFGHISTIHDIESEKASVKKVNVSYDPQYNMCVTIKVTNNEYNKRIVGVKATIQYISNEKNSVDAEDVTAKTNIAAENSDLVYLYGNPKPTYKYMMLGEVIVYYSDGTKEKI